VFAGTVDKGRGRREDNKLAGARVLDVLERVVGDDDKAHESLKVAS
jgi:hypothetical protein